MRLKQPLDPSVVGLVKRDGWRLVVAGIDVFNGPPLLDIKGYSAGYRPDSYAIPKWHEQLKA